MAGAETVFQPMPNAAWAWEGLRRNKDYHGDYVDLGNAGLREQVLASGARLLSQTRACAGAEKWGLLTFANPFKSAMQTHVFWQPDLFKAALRVELTPLSGFEAFGDPEQDIIILSAIRTRRVLLDTADGMRHILLGGSRFWIQLHCTNHGIPDDHDGVAISMKNTVHMTRRIDTAKQLLSLHRAGGGKISLIGRRKETDRLQNALSAYDIHHGFERPRGTLADIAEMIVGPDRMAMDWGKDDRSLKRQARRCLAAGEAIVAGKYRDLLSRKAI